MRFKMMTPTVWMLHVLSILCMILSTGVSMQDEDRSQSWLFIVVILGGILVTSALAYIFFPAIVSAYGPRVRFEEQRLLGNLSMSSNDDIRHEQQQQQHRRPLLSLVIPAYNEELRLEIMLQEAYDYLSQTPTCPALQEIQRAAATVANTRIKKDDDSDDSKRIIVEWIVVNDGSTDDTVHVYKAFIQKIQQSSTSASSSLSSSSNVEMQWKLINLLQNSGKGAAVQAGMLSSYCSNSTSGSYYSLMVDADGATEFGTGLERLANHAAMTTTSDDAGGGGGGGAHFILGSRAQERNDNNDSSNDNGVQRTLIRRFLQSLFHSFVVLLVGTSEVQDTQCGFKLFAGSVVPDLFQQLHLRRWAFDTELLVRAKYMKLNIKEVVVPWHEVDGSKLNTSPFALIRVAISMLRDMICVRLCYSMKIWKVETTTTLSTAAKSTRSTATTSRQERKEQ